MLTKGSVEWSQDLLDRYEAVRGRMTQVEFCEREGVSHNAFVHRRFGKWPHRRTDTRAAVTDAEPVTMLPVKVVEPASGPKLAWVEAEVRAGVVLRFLPGTNAEYVASLLLRLADGGLPPGAYPEYPGLSLRGAPDYGARASPRGGRRQLRPWLHRQPAGKQGMRRTALLLDGEMI